MSSLHDLRTIERVWEAAARESVVPLVPSFRPVTAAVRRIAAVVRAVPPRMVVRALNRDAARSGLRFRRGRSASVQATMTRSSGAITIDVPLAAFDGATFPRDCETVLRHEQIHLAQRAVIGAAAYRRRLSGYDCARLLLERGGSRRQAARLYLGDPFEVMAWASTLADEWLAARPAHPRRVSSALRTLSVWQRYTRAGFDPAGAVMSSLLRQAKVYVTCRIV